MKHFTVIITLLSFFVIGCSEPKKYEPTKVKIISEGVIDLGSDQGLALTFEADPESNYHCPGVLYKQDGYQIFFEYVRCSIDSNNSEVDLVASKDKEGNLTVIFPFPASQHKIELINSEGTSLGSWTRSNIKNR